MGREIIDHLLATGKYAVHSMDLFIPPSDKRTSGIVSYIQADITCKSEVLTAAKGMEVVFHTASLVPTSIRNTDEVMERVNVGGTRNVVSACQQQGVKRLVYTSSCSVIFATDSSGYEMLERYGDVCESTPLPKDPLNAYAKTKGEAETLVREANDDSGSEEGLRTCALRLGGLVAGKKTPVMRALTNFMIGHGQYYMSWVTLKSAAEVHLLAEGLLARQPLTSSNNCFNVASSDIKYKEINEFFCLAYNGKTSATLNLRMLFICAYVNEFLYWLFGLPLFGDDLGLMVVQLVCPFTLSRAHTERMLGWRENRPWKEVMAETLHRQYY